ncbi:hypothetical protein [Laspinema palackyanum]|uniref:hypothetical protein n=1 Tax=Laspinema palackyanum TaxID=3231601 RepID=UPI00345CD96D|nr:hypothetical protein [Laspinema sp. D2c]
MATDTLLDRVMGSFCAEDVFIAWKHIQSALVATQKDDVDLFLDQAALWERNIKEQREEKLFNEISQRLSSSEES